MTTSPPPAADLPATQILDMFSLPTSMGDSIGLVRHLASVLVFDILDKILFLPSSIY
jgi:hypothetical protein